MTTTRILDCFDVDSDGVAIVTIGEEKMFQVFDNGRPADCNYHKVHSTWNKSTFNSFEEAQKYCRLWLGWQLAESTPSKLNQKIDYSGYGDIIEIREV